MSLTFERKLLRVMRLTSVILLTCCIHVAAKSVSQTVTYKGTNVPLEKIFTVVEEQTGYLFIYNPALLDKAKPVSVAAENMPLQEFLSDVLANQSLEFAFNDRTVIIKRKENVAPVIIKTTLLPISGTVKAVDGKPLANVSVTVKGTDKGTTTDADGKFNIDVKQGDVLVISSVGFGSKEVKINSANSSLIIALDISSSPLDEVQIIAYGETSKRFNTGNVSSVKSEDISKQPVGDPVAALAARVPGLQVTQLSGAPGRAFNIQIRGRNSIANGGSPLFIVDGVPFFNNTTRSFSSSSTTIDVNGVDLGSGMNTSPFSAINPNDIESIEVLKDADATAIYGSRGANGVILITTKKGHAGETKVTANVYHAVGKITRQIPLLNTQQYLALRHEAFKNDNVTDYPFNAYDINGTWDTTRYTDWQDVFFGRTSHTTDAQASVSGGNANTQFLLGVAYRNESTVFPGDFGSRRGSANYNMNHTSQNGRFRFNFSGLYSYAQHELPLNSALDLMLLPPDAPRIYNDDGTLNWENGTWNNPMNLIYQRNTTKIKYSNSGLNLSYDLFQGLQLKANVGYSSTTLTQMAKTPGKFFNPFFPATADQAYTIFGTNDISVWNAEPQLEYKTSFGKLDMDLLAGSTFMQQLQDGKAFKGTGYSSDELMNNLQAASVVAALPPTYTKYKYNAIFTRLNFNFDRRYIISLTGRRDGSSRFGPGRQFASFGAVGAAWIFTANEYLRQRLPFLSFGKIRASYGTTGNDQIGDYQFLDTYQPYLSEFPYLGQVGLQPTRLLNQDYAWEVNKKLEGAIELGLLKDRLLIDFSYYRNRSSNQLVEQAISSQVGFATLVENLPAVVQNSGWEMQLNSINIRNKNFNWTSSFNISIPKNKLIAYPDLTASPNAFSYVVGEPLTIAKKLKYDKLDETTGLYTFIDTDKDANIGILDYQTIVFMGQQYFGGLGNNLTYKNFDLSLLFQYVRQRHAPNYTTFFNRPGSMDLGNQPTYVLNRWKKPGDNTQVQMVGNNFPATLAYIYFRQSDAAYTNGSYIRLKNISLSYTINFKQRFALRSLKMYVNAQNLLTITSYKGLDPETKGFLPPLKVISAGLQIDL